MNEKDDKTIFAVRIKKESKNIIYLFLFFLLFFLVMVLFGAIQYLHCRQIDPDVTPQECFANKHKKNGAIF